MAKFNFKVTSRDHKTVEIDALNIERDVDACIWASALGMGETMFKSLRPGDRFVFRADEKDRPQCVLVRTIGGYRHEIGGRQWKTGARAACFKL